VWPGAFSGVDDPDDCLESIAQFRQVEKPRRER
jgi:hypothetical protein